MMLKLFLATIHPDDLSQFKWDSDLSTVNETVFSRNILQPAFGNGGMENWRYNWPLGTATGTDENGNTQNLAVNGRGYHNAPNFGTTKTPTTGYPLTMLSYPDMYVDNVHPNRMHLIAQ